MFKLFFSLKYHFEIQIHVHHPTRGVRDYSPSPNNFYVKLSRYTITYNKNIVYVGVPGVSSVPKKGKSIVNVSLFKLISHTNTRTSTHPGGTGLISISKYRLDHV